MWALWFLVPIGLLSLVAIYDRRQRSNTIIANFPIIGRFRYWFEALGGPLRQYIVTNNDEERPFTRDQRRWVYASAQNENNYFGFGTDNELEQTTGYLIIRQSTFPISSPVKGMPGYTLSTVSRAPRSWAPTAAASTRSGRSPSSTPRP